MTGNDERGVRFRRTFWEAAILLIVACAVTGGLWALQTHLESKDEEAARLVAQDRVLSQREGCRRSNKGLRAPLYEFLVTAEKARLATARQSTEAAERRVNNEAAREYRRLSDQMVAASADYALALGSPIIDCQKAYPFNPTPFEGG